MPTQADYDRAEQEALKEPGFKAAWEAYLATDVHAYAERKAKRITMVQALYATEAYKKLHKTQET